MSTLLDKSLSVATETLTCGECGIGFAVPAWWVENRRKDHTIWYCPNGHQRAFLAKTAEQKKIEQLEHDSKWYANRLKDETAEKDAARRSLAATRGVLTRTKNKIAAGECPCCHKEFKVLAKHMANEHPDYLTTDDPSPSIESR